MFETYGERTTCLCVYVCVLCTYRAGGVANEVIASVRTVASLTAEEHEFARYSHHLAGAEAAGIMSGEWNFLLETDIDVGSYTVSLESWHVDLT